MLLAPDRAAGELVYFLVCLNDLQDAREHLAASLAAYLLVCLSSHLRDVYPVKQHEQTDVKVEVLARCMGNT